jgi:preprotein translocase subunit SecD
MFAVAMLAVGSQIWSRGSTPLLAAVRFEVRLAEEQPAVGLREARVAGSERVIYLHDDIIVTNVDIDRSRVVPGDKPSGFWIDVQFTGAGAQKMRQATANHVGRPLAILIDGTVIMAPLLRSPIGTSAMVTGDYTRAEAERLVEGMSIR